MGAEGLLSQTLLETFGKDLLGQLATDEDHFCSLFFVGQPGFTGFGAHQHMDTLKEHSFIDALHVKNALVTQKIGSVDLNYATEKLLEALWIKGLVGFKNKRADIVVVRSFVRMTMIMIGIGAGRGIMVVIVAMSVCVIMLMIAVPMIVIAMTVIMVVIVIVRGIGVIVGQKLRIDIQNGVEVKTADVDDLFQISIAKVDGLDGGARVHVHDTATQGGIFGFGHEIFFGDQNTICKANLFLSFFLFVEDIHAVLGIDDGDDRIESVVLGDVIVHEKRLTNGARVGHAGGFNDHAFEFKLATFVALAQVEQRAHQIAADGAANAAVGKLDDFLILILDEKVVVDALGSEFVFDHRDTLTVVLRQDAF